MTEKLTKLQIDRINKFMKRMEEHVIIESIPFNATYSWSKEPVPFAQRLQGEYKEIKEGEIWGGTWESAWFHLQGNIPEGWKGKKVVAQLDFEGEGLMVSPDGFPIQGITHRSIWDKNFSREFVHLYDCAKGGEKVELWVEAAGSSLFGVFLDEDPREDDPNRFGHYQGKVTRMRLCVFDEALWHLLLDMEILRGLVQTLPEKSVRRARIIRNLNEALDVFGDNPTNAKKSREVLRKELKKPAAPSDLTAVAVGHAHIDTGWLWPVWETVRKCVRTFASQIRLLEKYPSYIFGASQPQHYLFVKEKYPNLYEKIKKFVKEGRWELQGGMWVEADCNLISGESMVRQFIHGKNFFMDEFGIDVKNLWLPDVFGYSAAMPQILAKSGIDYFLTQKLSWNQFNDFPHHTFKWRGIDGSEIITHFPPENNYNSMLNTKYLVPGRDNFKEKDLLDEFMSLYGIGDGGGGPKEENIECGIRMEDLEGAPKVKFGRADEFFERLRKYENQLPTWIGELYLELHRGTLTSQARVKRANRKLELKLREVEFLWSCLPLKQYPGFELDAIWKKLLINQFHDILPGSSVNAVYQVTHKEYREALEKCQELAAQAANLLFREDENSLVLLNSLSYPYHGVFHLPEGWDCQVADETGKILPGQRNNGKSVVFIELGALSFATLKKIDQVYAAIKPDNDLLLENELIRYEFSDNGTLKSAFDKEAGREVMSVNQEGNMLSLYADRPNEWDAWDIDILYEHQLLQTAECIKIEKIAQGPVWQCLKFEFQVGRSRIEQIACLSRGSKRLDFETRVNWREKHRMLRVAFPVDIFADQASFDIQYGHVKRNTHRNTSWDMAKFEVAAQRYADLSDKDYGVALLNDCKYGYKVHDNVLDLNLLRATTNPDPDADQGEQFFIYSFLPHSGDLIHSNVIAEAALLNLGVSVFSGYSLGKAEIPCRLEGEGLSLEVLKKAEKDYSLIIRIVEVRGKISSGYLTFMKPPLAIVETNLLEWTNDKEYPTSDRIEINLQPFEIKTYKIKTKS